MIQYGLIGKSLGHSFSPGYFARKFATEGLDAEYKAFEIAAIDMLPDVLNAYPLLKGLNVTIPYKESVIALLHEVDAAAAIIGAVNCIGIEPDGRLKGFNTDWLGFGRSVATMMKEVDLTTVSALVFGTGGAAKAVWYALQQLGISYLTVSRGVDGDLRYTDLDAAIMKEHQLLVNTTPIGMYPDVTACLPLSADWILPHHFLYDLIYNPDITAFMRLGLERKARVKNGLEMLHIQAEESWAIWKSVY